TALQAQSPQRNIYRIGTARCKNEPAWIPDAKELRNRGPGFKNGTSRIDCKFVRAAPGISTVPKSMVLRLVNLLRLWEGRSGIVQINTAIHQSSYASILS